MGLRFRVTDHVALFMEGRYWMNSFTFNRNYANESDSITMQGAQLLGGVGAEF